MAFLYRKKGQTVLTHLISRWRTISYLALWEPRYHFSKQMALMFLRWWVSDTEEKNDTDTGS